MTDDQLSTRLMMVFQCCYSIRGYFNN